MYQLLLSTSLALLSYLTCKNLISLNFGLIYMREKLTTTVPELLLKN